ncbi:chaperone protein dnaJ C76, chloroplastic [Andrographis paniculata]|uniref:chaperone protein dnaJ C76, chloroplastic n=1 Tax=Andrographis paniculata TaxID=175694 RepID=UPI0021E78EAD|nr:chaperone protein dnaJ C76, chloroplastic [Andrographis paniculata]
MQAVSAPFLHYAPCAILPSPNPKTTTFGANKHPSSPGSRWSVASCRASSPTTITEFNLYELLGVEASSDKAQIKEAYRALQKRCHPDIAGPAGHDMAIVLNEAYALLSDPNARLAYDKELEKVADLHGYTGRPMYSVWLGSEQEERAVFVDEVKCIGCLKCALFASKTFAVESVYGRARVVAQWADPEGKIQEAIGACPVNCISMVERSNLAALEYLMSKQPRGRVRVGAGNTAGMRTSDVFDEMEKFQARYADYRATSKESEDQMASRMSAIQAIQMISNWLYWQSPNTEATPLAATQNYSQVRSRGHNGQSMKRLKAAADARKQGSNPAKQTESMMSNSHEYWVPTSNAIPEVINSVSTPNHGANPIPNRKMNRSSDGEVSGPKKGSNSPLRWGVPIGTAMVAAAVVRLHLGEPSGGLEDHLGGSMALAIVNSSWSPVALAGVTWYLISMYVVELVEALRRK